MMNLLIDIDGCICTYDFPRITKEIFGVAVPNDGIWTYDLETSLGVATEDVTKMFVSQLYVPPNFQTGAMETLRHFMDKGDMICVFTNRLAFMLEQQLHEWLTKYEIPTHAIVKTPLNGVYDFHIDDSPRKMMNVDKHTLNKLLFNNPWNSHCLNITGKLQRVHSWAEIRKVIDKARSLRYSE